MATEFDDFHAEFFQEVLIGADAKGQYSEDVFFETFSAQVVDSGELETADRTQYLSSTGRRVDGYGGDPLDSDGVLSLIVCDFNQSADVTTLTRTEMDAAFKRVTNFVDKALDDSFRKSLEDTSAAFGLADLISKRWSAITKIKMLLMSNRILSSKVDGRAAGQIDAKPVTYSVWDLSRLSRYANSSGEREEIEINLMDDFGRNIPAIPAHLTDADYEAYLAIVPGEQLAAIYDRYGVRLLEQNVRVFLQARTKVNRGMRNTLENDSEMFFAYNNGITATAESVNVLPTKNGLELTQLKNLQIVNGGQTTASIYAASLKKDVDLSKVFVQMKLSVIEPDQALEVVPKISEYANTQNKVNAADFFSNHPYHVRLENFSRRVFAPSPDESFREDKWFYERARGQYLDARGNRTVSGRKKFDLEYPKAKKFAKTDLAKYLNVWRDRPHTVSKGAQKNFADFAQYVGTSWDKNSNQFNELNYRQSIAKAIIFKGVEKLVSAQDWYEGGYRANIVAYAISKLSYDVKDVGSEIDFEKVWRQQALTLNLEAAFAVGTKAVHDVIVSPPPSVRNVTEWAKQELCWKRVKELNIPWPEALRNELLSADEKKDNERSAVKVQKVMNGIEAQMAVVNAGAQFWSDAEAWAVENKMLSATELGIFATAALLPNKIPTERQSAVALEALRKLQEEGCQLQIEAPVT
jgi:hypothetical protein